MPHKTIAVAVAALLVSSIATAAGSRARELAQAAYATAREHPFEGEVLQRAAADVETARGLDPNEPYVFLAISELALDAGYDGGDPYSAPNYDERNLRVAAAAARHATELDPALADAHIEFARVMIPMRDFNTVQHELFTAHKLDPENFYAWFYQAIAYWKQAKVAQSERALEGATAHAKTKHERRILLQHKTAVARSRGIPSEVEKAYKQIIELDPSDAWAHGNYANFLCEQSRWDACVNEYEIAVKLVPYPIAVRGLEDARKMRDQFRK